MVHKPGKKHRREQARDVVIRPQFYRGRTSVTTEVAAKQRAQKAYRRKKLSQQRREQFIKRCWQWGRRLFSLGVIVFLFLQTWLSGDVQFRKSELDNDDKQQIELAVREYLGMNNNHFIFTAKVDEMEAHIRKRIPSLGQIDIHVPWYGRYVTVYAQQAGARYNFTSAQVIPGVEQAVVSNNGVLAGAAENDQSQSTSRVTLVDETGVEYALGDQVLSDQQLTFLAYAEGNLRLQNLTLTEVHFDNTPRQMKLYVQEKDYYFIVSTDRSSAVLANELTDALGLITEKGIVVREYVDLTVTDKVFYK